MRKIEEGTCWATDGGDRKGEESLITENEGGCGGVREKHVGWFSGQKNYTRLTNLVDIWFSPCSPLRFTIKCLYSSLED